MRISKLDFIVSCYYRRLTLEKYNIYEANLVIKADTDYKKSWEIWQDIIIRDTGEQIGKKWYQYWKRHDVKNTGRRLMNTLKGQ